MSTEEKESFVTAVEMLFDAKTRSEARDVLRAHVEELLDPRAQELVAAQAKHHADDPQTLAVVERCERDGRMHVGPCAYANGVDFGIFNEVEPRWVCLAEFVLIGRYLARFD